MNGAYRASDGYLLQYRHWSPHRGTPRAQIVALHGIQSHAGWYTYSSRRLAEAGYEVFFLDRRGSGLNRRSRGHAVHAERLMNDVAQFLSALRDRSAIPTVLLGASWGGKLAAATALARPDLVSATALLYPGLFPKSQPTWRDRAALAWADFRGWGQGRIAIPLNDPALFTDDPRWQEFIRRDELSLYQVTVDFLRTSHELTRRIESGTSLSKPALLMLAGRDDIIDNARTRAWFERTASEPRTLIEYPNARHTLEFESHPDEFIDDLLTWLGAVT